MPTYDYLCDACGHQFEAFQSMKDDALKVCPECAETALRRLITGGAGVIFKGSGFYVNDSKRAGSSSGTSKSGSTGSDSGNGSANTTGDGAKAESSGSGKSESGKGESSKSDSGSAGGSASKSGEKKTA